MQALRSCSGTHCEGSPHTIDKISLSRDGRQGRYPRLLRQLIAYKLPIIVDRVR